MQIVTGDTKVVGKGAADGVYISTAGVGVIPRARRCRRDLVQPGDKVLVSGTIGDHGMAVMLARGDLAIDADIASDTAPVNELVEALLAAAPSTRWMRDATRGGVGTVCNELAKDTRSRSSSTRRRCPSSRRCSAPATCSASTRCTSPTRASSSRSSRPRKPTPPSRAARTPAGRHATVVGEIMPEPNGIVALRTSFGGSRIVDMLVGDPLPRIC